MLLFSAALLAGFFFLIFSADFFVKGTSAIARNLGVSPLIIGLTIVGLGTSAPEILVAGMASIQGNNGLATGNAIGSNIANIGLVLGSTALFAPILIKSSLLKRELPLLLTISIISYLLVIDGDLSRLDGLILIAGLVAFLYWLFRSAQQNKRQNADALATEFEDEIPTDLSNRSAFLYAITGLTGLIVSSKLLVWAAVNIAIAFGVSDLVIGLTIIAIGTSLPELAASIMSVVKKEPDLAVGNIIGSNAFNLLAVLCLPGLIRPGLVETQLISRDFPIMLGLTLLLLLFSYSANGEPKINRLKGATFMIFFVGYLSKVYLDTIGI
ncbi:MAG: calcium:proton antiporter [Cycloclasticus sp. Phe_18]|jgi:cation:H+ antiporter|nr:MAG: calcium:proton antiporter [Cycloclasticus sp. Phe_18]